MLERIKSFIEKHRLIQKGDKVLVALSGGPDSVALIYLLNQLKTSYNLTLGAAHINHMLRGASSDGDAEFTKLLCNKLDIEYFSKSVDIKEYSKRNSVGEEEAGREIRYGFFEDICNEYGYNKVAVAHNLDDNIETFLFRLMRGTSLEGLNAIPLVRDRIIRPFMNEKKTDILNYLDKNNIEYRIDESNFENIYTRNKIRLDLIPYIQKEFNTNFVDRTKELIQEVNSINTYLDKQIEKIVAKETLEIEELKSFDEIIRLRIWNSYLKKYKVEVSRKKIKKLDSLIFADGYKEYNLGLGFVFKKGYKQVSIEKKVEKTREKSKIALEIRKKIMYNGYVIESILVEKIPSKKDGFYFDYDKLNKDLFVRTRQEGDKFIPSGMKSQKKLKKFFIDSKVEKEKRDILPIIVSGEDIILVGDLRASNLYRVGKDTEKVLLLKVKEVGENEGR